MSPGRLVVICTRSVIFVMINVPEKTHEDDAIKIFQFAEKYRHQRAPFQVVDFTFLQEEIGFVDFVTASQTMVTNRIVLPKCGVQKTIIDRGHSRKRIAFQETACSKTSFSRTSSCSGSVPRSPQLMVYRGRCSRSATHSMDPSQLHILPMERVY